MGLYPLFGKKKKKIGLYPFNPNIQIVRVKIYSNKVDNEWVHKYG